MKTAPELQGFVLKVATHYGVDMMQAGAYLCLDKTDERLLIENLGACRISVSCQLYLYHDWVADPEIVFWVNQYGAWMPIEVTQVQGGWRCYAEVDPSGELEVVSDPNGQVILADFVEEEVAPNLLKQAWCAEGIIVTTERPVCTPEELWARQSVLESPWLPLTDKEWPDVPF